MSTSGVRSWSCICGFVDTFESVQIHFLTVHRKFSEDFSSMCSICNIQFSDPSILKQHSVLHIRQFTKSLLDTSLETKVQNSKSDSKSTYSENPPFKQEFPCYSSSLPLKKVNGITNNISNNSTESSSCCFNNVSSTPNNRTNNFQIVPPLSLNVTQPSTVNCMTSLVNTVSAVNNSFQGIKGSGILNANNNFYYMNMPKNQLQQGQQLNVCNSIVMPVLSLMPAQQILQSRLSDVNQVRNTVKNAQAPNVSQASSSQNKTPPTTKQQTELNNHTREVSTESKNAANNSVEKKTYDQATLRQIFQRSCNMSNDYNQIWSMAKTPKCKKKMLEKQNLMRFYKCMVKDCSFASNSNTNFIFHLSKHSNIAYFKCVYCLREFSAGITLVNHMTQEHGKRIYQCSQCFYRASRKLYVQIHQQIHHGKHSLEVIICKPVELLQSKNECIDSDYSTYAKPFHCSIGSCYFVTYDSLDFKKHNELNHKFVDMYPCSYCKSSCFSISSLIKHHHLHGINNYQCTYCLFGSSTKIEMLFHLSLHHADMPVNVYVRSSYEYIEGVQINQRLSEKEIVRKNDDERNTKTTDNKRNKSRTKQCEKLESDEISKVNKGLRRSSSNSSNSSLENALKVVDFQNNMERNKKVNSKINSQSSSVSENDDHFVSCSTDQADTKSKDVNDSKEKTPVNSMPSLKKKNNTSNSALLQKSKLRFSLKKTNNNNNNNTRISCELNSNCSRCNNCNYECSICLLHFKLFKDAKKHLKDVHCLWSSVRCAYCSRMGFQKGFLRRHIITKHPHKDMKIISYIKKILPKSTSSRMQHPYNCYFCSYGTANRCQIIKHMYAELDYKKYKCGICKLQLDKRALPNHFSYVHPNRVIDIIKNTNPHIRKWLKNFLQNSSNCLEDDGNLNPRQPSEFNCPFCQKQMKSQKCFQQHLYRHKQYKPFKCGHCSKKFLKISHFKIHKKNVRSQMVQKKAIKLFKTKIWHIENWAKEIIQNEQHTQNSQDLSSVTSKLDIHYVGVYGCFYCNFCANFRYLVERHCRIKHYKKPVRFLKNNMFCKETTVQIKNRSAIRKKCASVKKRKRRMSSKSTSEKTVSGTLSNDDLDQSSFSDNKQEKADVLGKDHLSSSDKNCSLVKATTSNENNIGFCIFNCAFCPEKFISLKTLKNHWQEKHKTSDDDHLLFKVTNKKVKSLFHVYRCMYCNVQCTIMRNLKSHIENEHKEKVFMMKITRNKTASGPTESYLQYYCNHCPMIFIEESKLRAHELEVHKISSSTDSESQETKSVSGSSEEVVVENNSSKSGHNKKELMVNVKFGEYSKEIKLPLSYYSKMYKIYPKVVLEKLFS
ncbi:zinc finger protein 62-like [Centruroides sculpturatus]|uniref:zinc finger protein 62-like n=1 Tax=Centruroides sculpturatus TaxID=218467 RepID=UPI000C6CCA74|nr:zinc finger protein 62-like [Centruroides sculpturatus]